MQRIFAAMVVPCALSGSAAAQEIVGSGSSSLGYLPLLPQLVQQVEGYCRDEGR
jgi:hypothetical protein